jgi:DNA-binding MltR family transcriptional regulator
MDFKYSTLFLSFGIDEKGNNKMHIDVEPFLEDSGPLADLFATIADTVINQLPESEQNDYENNLLKDFKKSMKTRHSCLEIRRTKVDE